MGEQLRRLRLILAVVARRRDVFVFLVLGIFLCDVECRATLFGCVKAVALRGSSVHASCVVHLVGRLVRSLRRGSFDGSFAHVAPH